MAIRRREQRSKSQRVGDALQGATSGYLQASSILSDRQENETLEELLERLLQGQEGGSEFYSPLTKPGLFSGDIQAPHLGGVNQELIGKILSRRGF